MNRALHQPLAWRLERVIDRHQLPQSIFKVPRDLDKLRLYTFFSFKFTRSDRMARQSLYEYLEKVAEYLCDY